MPVTYGFEIEPKGTTRPLFKQVHGNHIVEIRDGAHAESLRAAPPDGDAGFTRASHLTLYSFSADCIPWVFYTDDGPIAAAHCGWKGALRGVVPALIEKLGVPLHELRAAAGPCLRSCCFEVRQDFVDAFEAQGSPIGGYLEERNGRLYCRLLEYVRETQLGGLAEDRVDLKAARCTYCSTPPLPSFRRNKGTDPQIRMWIRRG